MLNPSRQTAPEPSRQTAPEPSPPSMVDHA